MKTVIMFIAAAGIMMLASCKKEWTCQCTDNSGNTTYHTISNATLHDANSTCNNFEYNLGGGLYNNCSLVQ
ncbi:MAG TPA: hypothetical protein VG603_07860 [Chitinophagales bacterium]|nr:hypothetical protein [Chitinophagales bacterium]